MLSYSESFAAGWGIFLVLIALLFLRLKSLPRLMFTYLNSPSKIRFIGLFMIILGCIHISFHNIFSPSYAALISAFGWLTSLKGLTLLANPKIIGLSKSIAKSHLFTTYLLLIIVLGLYLFNCAYRLI